MSESRTNPATQLLRVSQTATGGSDRQGARQIGITDESNNFFHQVSLIGNVWSPRRNSYVKLARFLGYLAPHGGQEINDLLSRYFHAGNLSRKLIGDGDHGYLHGSLHGVHADVLPTTKLAHEFNGSQRCIGCNGAINSTLKAPRCLAR